MKEKTLAQQAGVKEFPFVIKDDKGNLVYLENEDGYWVKSEYNEFGNLTYVENSDGYWAKTVYDSEGNEVYYENSDGCYSGKKCEKS